MNNTETIQLKNHYFYYSLKNLQTLIPCTISLKNILTDSLLMDSNSVTTMLLVQILLQTMALLSPVVVVGG
jgi:hypothetical protein